MNEVEREVHVRLLVKQIEVLGVGDELGPQGPAAEIDGRGAQQDAAGELLLGPFPSASREAFQPLLGELDERAGHHETHHADHDDHADPDHHRQEHGIVHNNLRSRTLPSDKGKREILNLSIAHAAEKGRGTTGSRWIQAGP